MRPFGQMNHKLALISLLPQQLSFSFSVSLSFARSFMGWCCCWHWVIVIYNRVAENLLRFNNGVTTEWNHQRRRRQTERPNQVFFRTIYFIFPLYKLFIIITHQKSGHWTGFLKVIVRRRCWWCSGRIAENWRSFPWRSSCRSQSRSINHLKS